MQPNSRSVQRRIAAQKGEPVPQFDEAAHDRYELDDDSVLWWLDATGDPYKRAVKYLPVHAMLKVEPVLGKPDEADAEYKIVEQLRAELEAITIERDTLLGKREPL